MTARSRSSAAARVAAPFRSLERLASDATWYIWIVGGLLAATFTWLELREIPFGDALAGTRHDYLIRFALVFYYLSWVGGASFDVRLQRSVYSIDPDRHRSRVPTIFVIAVFALVAIVLLWVKDDERKFALALTAFLIANLVGWRHIVRIVIPIIESSEKFYRRRKDYFGLQQLHCVAHYMTGRWQRRRFALLLAVMLVINVVTFFPDVRQAFARALHPLMPNVPAASIGSLLPAGMFIVLIAAGEGWMWFMRARTRLWLDVIDVLHDEYVLKRRA